MKPIIEWNNESLITYKDGSQVIAKYHTSIPWSALIFGMILIVIIYKLFTRKKNKRHSISTSNGTKNNSTFEVNNTLN